LKQSIESYLTIADLRVRPVVDRVAAFAPRDPRAAEVALGDWLRAQVEDIDQIESFVLIQPDGDVVWATADALIGLNLADRDYFGESLAGPPEGYALGVPVMSRGTNRRVVPIAWPVRTRSGLIVAVVASALGENYFEGLLSAVEDERDVAIEMTTRTGQTAFASHDISANDGLRLSAGVEATDRAFGITVSIPRSVALAGFNRRTATFLAVTALLTAVAIWALYVASKRARQLSLSLEQSERDRRQIARQSREQEAIFENVRDGIAAFADDGSFSKANARAVALMNAVDEKSCIELLRDRIASHDSTEAELDSFELLEQVQHANDHRDIRIGVTRIKEVGRPSLHYVVLSDMSEERKLFEARENFISSVNHELRTPLTSLKGSIEMLTARYAHDLPGSGSRLLDLAARNAERLLVLVNDVLTLQALDENRLSIRPERLSMGEIVDEAVATNEGYATSHGVRIETLGETEGVSVDVDRVRIQQIMSNLLSNAIKYSPSGDVVRLLAAAQADRAVLEVIDNGPGIPAEMLPNLFERFGAPVHDPQVQVAGTGLGLAITAELVERMHGSIEVTPGRTDSDGKPFGTRVAVSFPLAQAPMEEQA